MKEIDILLKRLIDENQTPSVQYIFFDWEKIIYESFHGYADISNRRKTGGNTTYNGYSVTKTFTALAVLQLAERGKLSIDDPVIKHLDNFPYDAGITVRQLLSHSAGLPNPLPLNWIHLAREHDSFDRNHFFNEVFKKNPRLKFRPNEKFAYSNLGYILLGQLIEKISGIDYENYIRHNILVPCGILSAEMDFIITDSLNHAKGYHKNWSFSYLVLNFLLDTKKYMQKETSGRWKAFNDFYVNGTSYGGLIGTSESFVKYLQQLLKPESKLLNDDSMKMLLTENLTNSGRLTGMCLAWFKDQLRGETYYTHAGGGGGYYCEMRIYPGKRKGSVIMFNRTGFTDERFLSVLDKYLL